jgi:ComF family protein
MVLRWLGDLFSPPACAACGEAVRTGRQAFCRACARSIERYAGDDACVAFGLFGGALAVAIRRLKYQQRPDLARPLGSLLRRACRDARSRAEVVVPVPLHESRLVERGYNQAALLGAHLAREMGARFDVHALIRHADTPPQAALSRVQRLANVADAFSVVRPERIRTRVVALVDDVTTTGATLDACRHALLGAGAKSVRCFVVAATPGPPAQLAVPADAEIEKEGSDFARSAVT